MNFINSIRQTSSNLWFFQPGYFQGVFWSNLMAVSSVLNDVIMCYVGKSIPVIEVSFFRFFFSTLVLLPFVVHQGKKKLLTNRVSMHVIRIVLGAIGLWLGCLAVNYIPLSQNTAITFVQPLFFLPMAALFLKEKIGYSRVFATILGFLGLIYLIQPGSSGFNAYSLIPIIATFIFAILDVMTKKMVATETTLTLLFYFGLGSSLLTFPFAMYSFMMPTFFDLFLLLCLGVGANLIQVFLFLAFKATDASALAPFRYVEFLFSLLFGFIFFSQVPSTHIFIGAGLIILSNFYVAYMERKASLC